MREKVKRIKVTRTEFDALSKTANPANVNGDRYLDNGCRLTTGYGGQHFVVGPSAAIAEMVRFPEQCEVSVDVNCWFPIFLVLATRDAEFMLANNNLSPKQPFLQTDDVQIRYHADHDVYQIDGKPLALAKWCLHVSQVHAYADAACIAEVTRTWFPSRYVIVAGDGFLTRFVIIAPPHGFFASVQEVRQYAEEHHIHEYFTQEVQSS